MMRKWVLIGLVASLLTTLMIGCSGTNSKESNGAVQSTTLKVMAYSEDYFYQEYGMLFTSLYPEIKIEVINVDIIYDELLEKHNQSYAKALEEFIDVEQPDVILVEDPSAVAQLVDEGRLYHLDSLVVDKAYDSEGLIPWTIENMKDIGMGKIYTLPTIFNTQVLYYNKDLFDQYNIPYPTDQMAWEEVYKLAEHFPVSENQAERIFGLSMVWSENLSELAIELSRAHGLYFYDNDPLRMTINTPAWAALLEQGLQMLESDALFYGEMMYIDELYDSAHRSFTKDPFINGRLAMKLESNHYMSTIEEAQKNILVADNIIQRWDIVTAPVIPEQPDATSYTHFSNLVAINAASPNVDAAWSYISYITSDDFARVKSKTQYASVPMRTKYLHKDNERNYAAMYKLKPIHNNQQYYVNVPQRFLFEFEEEFQQVLLKLTEGELTTEEALADLDLKGNALLQTDYMTKEQFEQYLNERNVPGVILR